MTNPNPDAAKTRLKPKRRWYQYSLRTLLIFVAICGVACAWLLHAPQPSRLLATVGWGGYSYTDTEFTMAEDGSYFATGGDENLAVYKRNDSGYGEVDLATMPNCVGAIRFTHDTKTLLCVDEKELSQVDLGTANLVKQYPLQIHTLDLSSDDKLVALGYFSGKVALRDFPGMNLKWEKQVSSKQIVAVAIAPQADRIAVLDETQKLTVCDTATGKVVAELGLPDLFDRAALSFVRDGQCLAISRFSQNAWDARLWDIKAVRIVDKRPDLCGVWTPNGKYFFSCQESGVDLISLDTGKSIPLVAIPREEIFLPVAARISANGNFLLVRCDSEHVYVWNVKGLAGEE